MSPHPCVHLLSIANLASYHAFPSLVVHQALFPDNSYSHDSGGDPEVIPQLTFEQFQDFHARYYHPSNGRFWFYGDDDATKRLQILDAYLR
jgi:Zn-dependent M16 (insulinase) family peptidase